jgi:predicted esterase
MRVSYCVAAAALLALPAGASAQVARFELGQRLRAFDRALAAHPDRAARKRALPALLRATAAFFTGRSADAGRALNQARLALLSDKAPSPAAAWAESLYVQPAFRFVDTDAVELPLTLRAFYEMDAPLPEGARLRLVLAGAAGKEVRREVAVTAVPQKETLGLAGVGAGDHTLRVEILVAGQVLAQRALTISRTAGLRQRLVGLTRGLVGLRPKRAGTGAATAEQLLETLQALADGKTLETNYPADRLLAEAEAVVRAAAAGKEYYGPERTGQFWMRLVTSAGPVPVRVLLPAAAKKGKPLPLVIALHGLGASENLFFEGYGAGAIVRLCEERGWLLVAPRTAGLNFAAPVGAVLDEVARLYPVDRRRVFLVGHSMGAAQAVGAAVKAPGRYAAVAALSGGERVVKEKGLEQLPFFVGVGDHDFALRWSRGLAEALRKAGVQTVRYREYADAEHLVVVQIALADVFAFFDEAARR